MTMESGSTSRGAVWQICLLQLLVVPKPHHQDRYRNGSGGRRTEVGIQPTSLVMDKNHKMWTITDGGYEGSPYGYEAPSLYRIDAETFTVEKQFKFKMGDWPSEVQLNGTGDKLYWINKDIWSMDVDAERVPVRPFLEYSGTIYYGLTVDPVRGDVYVADAIDYQQQGIVYRYSSEGELIDEFYVGIIPGAFCWK